MSEFITINAANIVTVPFVTMGIKAVDKALFNPITNHFAKPTGGLWTSPLLTINPEEDQVISAWHLFCYTEMSDRVSNDAVVLTLKPSARILVLDTIEKALAVFNEFHHTPIPECASMTYLDYERLSLSYDGVYATEDVIFGGLDFMYTWDCDSMVLFNLDCIESSEYHELDICDKDADEEELKKKLDDAEQKFYSFSAFATTVNPKAEEIFCNTMSLIHEVSEEAHLTDTPEYELNKQMISIYKEAISKLDDSEERDLKAEEDADTEAAYLEFMDKCEREQRERIESEDEEIEQNDQKYNNDVILW